MKYVSPKYELEVLETEDIMGISMFGAIFETSNDTDKDGDGDVDNSVSVSVGVDKLLP
ncbi:MAG: hypothetical protein IJ400_03265 [Clostridia bacterium]|nr:hypothetical protein [Clostridia bacterium]